MANAYTNSFIHNMGLNEKNSLPHLLDRISPEMENASLIEHSKYYNAIVFIPWCSEDKHKKNKKFLPTFI